MRRTVSAGTAVPARPLLFADRGLPWLSRFLSAVQLCLLASCHEVVSSHLSDAAQPADAAVPSPKPGSRCDELGFWWATEIDRWVEAQDPCTMDEDCIVVSGDVTCATPDGDSLLQFTSCDGSVRRTDKEAYEVFRSELAENLCGLESLPECVGTSACSGGTPVPFCGDGRCQVAAR